jgi:dihydrofolate reductase
MGKIVISTNATLDGVVQDPDGQEGFQHGGWFKDFVGADLQEWDKLETEEVLGAEALLLGGRSYDWFAKRLPSRPGEWADRVEHLPKYVVSSTVKDPEWNNSTLIAGDVVKQLSELKQKVDGEIIVYGSYQLVRTLIEQDLADELRLFVFPVVLGTGARLFDGISNTKPTRLIDARVVDEDLVFYAYEFVRDTASTTAG